MRSTREFCEVTIRGTMAYKPFDVATEKLLYPSGYGWMPKRRNYEVKPTAGKFSRSPTKKQLRTLELHESGFTYREIAKMLGVASVFAVKRRLLRLRRSKGITLPTGRPPTRLATHLLGDLDRVI
jgi:hypothetical protein